MAGVMPDGVVRVAESGVRGASDAAALRDAGYHAVLVGETLVTAGDPLARSVSCSVGTGAGCGRARPRSVTACS